MRSLAICAALAIAALAASARTNALADWCAKSPSGATNCGYATLAQCAAKVSNTGGACIQVSGSGPGTAPPEPDHVRRQPPDRTRKEAAPKRQEPVRTGAPPTPAAEPVTAPAPIPAAAAGPVPPAQRQPLDFAGARQLILGGQYDAGIAAMRALKFDDHPDVATFLGLAYRKLGRLDEARVWYERALTVDPNHRLALSFYGMMQAETGDMNSARANLEKLKLVCGGTECNEYQALAGYISSLPRP
jgi:tetratricopeptide (TPR) repeat protein